MGYDERKTLADALQRVDGGANQQANQIIPLSELPVNSWRGMPYIAWLKWLDIQQDRWYHE